MSLDLYQKYRDLNCRVSLLEKEKPILFLYRQEVNIGELDPDNYISFLIPEGTTTYTITDNETRQIVQNIAPNSVEVFLDGSILAIDRLDRRAYSVQYFGRLRTDIVFNTPTSNDEYYIIKFATN